MPGAVLDLSMSMMRLDEPAAADEQVAAAGGKEGEGLQGESVESMQSCMSSASSSGCPPQGAGGMVGASLYHSALGGHSMLMATAESSLDERTSEAAAAPTSLAAPGSESPHIGGNDDADSDDMFLIAPEDLSVSPPAAGEGVGNRAGASGDGLPGNENSAMGRSAGVDACGAWRVRVGVREVMVRVQGDTTLSARGLNVLAQTRVDPSRPACFVSEARSSVAFERMPSGGSCCGVVRRDDGGGEVHMHVRRLEVAHDDLPCLGPLSFLSPSAAQGTGSGFNADNTSCVMLSLRAVPGAQGAQGLRIEEVEVGVYGLLVQPAAVRCVDVLAAATQELLAACHAQRESADADLSQSAPAAGGAAAGGCGDGVQSAPLLKAPCGSFRLSLHDVCAVADATSILPRAASPHVQAPATRPPSGASTGEQGCAFEAVVAFSCVEVTLKTDRGRRGQGLIWEAEDGGVGMGGDGGAGGEVGTVTSGRIDLDTLAVFVRQVDGARAGGGSAAGVVGGRDGDSTRAKALARHASPKVPYP